MFKNKLKRQNIIILSLMICLIPNSILANESDSNEFNKNEKTTIDEQFPGYRLLKETDLGDWEQSILKEDFGDKNFFLIRDDFDGNSSGDFACLLYNSKLEKVAFAIFLSSSKHYKLSYKEVWNTERWGENIILILIEVGTQFYDLDNTDVPITLKNPGIKFIEIGKSSSVYFWDTKKQKIDAIGTFD